MCRARAVWNIDTERATRSGMRHSAGIVTRAFVICPNATRTTAHPTTTQALDTCQQTRPSRTSDSRMRKLIQEKHASRRQSDPKAIPDNSNQNWSGDAIHCNSGPRSQADSRSQKRNNQESQRIKKNFDSYLESIKDLPERASSFDHLSPTASIIFHGCSAKRILSTIH